MDKAEEKTLVRKLVRMDERAWEKFCREYSPPLLQFIQFYLGCNQGKAEEVVHMTFIRCVRSIRTFNPSRGRLFPWLKAVARNEGHSFMRKNQRNLAETSLSSLPQHIADRILKEMDNSPLPDEILARKELQLLIHELLLDMNSRYREVLIMKYIDGLRVSEIAVKLSSSEKAIESLLSRAREAFRRVFFEKVIKGGESIK